MDLNALQEGKFEIWYVRFIDPETTESVLIDFMKFPEEDLCRVVFEPGDGEGLVSMDRFKPGTLRASSYTLKLKLGHNEFEPHGLKGAVGEKPKIEFDLTCEPGNLGIDYNPQILKRLKIANMMLATPALEARFSGIVRIDGKEHRYSQVPGTQTHYWGRRFYPGWIYLSCNTFPDSDLIFEINAPQLPLLGIAGGTCFVRYQGREYRFNTLRTSFRNVRVLQDGRKGIWVSELTGGGHKFVFTVTASAEEMLLILDRGGQMVYYTGRADCLCSIHERRGPIWRKKEDVQASHTCAAELAVTGEETTFS